MTDDIIASQIKQSKFICYIKNTFKEIQNVVLASFLIEVSFIIKMEILNCVYLLFLLFRNALNFVYIVAIR
jgi:hypothetical protein